MRLIKRWGVIIVVLSFAACRGSEGSTEPSQASLVAAAAKEAAAEAYAQTAVTDYEGTPLESLAEVAVAETLEVKADSAVELVRDSTVRATFVARITKCAAIVASVKTKLEANALIVKAIMDSLRATETVALHVVPITTYDGSGQSVHPDVICFEKPWSGWKCWMALTPYANTNDENPSLYVSQDGEHWQPAPGVNAPLIGSPAGGYNSDPEWVFDKGNSCLSLVYREVVNDNAIKATESCDGITWSEPHLLFSLPDHQAISPSITVGPDGLKHVLYVDAGAVGCGARSTKLMTHVVTDSLFLSDSLPSETLNLVQPGYIIWHIKWRFIPEKQEWWALYAAYPVSTFGCVHNDLFLAVSRDMHNWTTFPAPVSSRLETRFNFESMYRATFLYWAKSDKLQIITSALESDLGWGEFSTTYDYANLLAALTLSSQVSSAFSFARVSPLVATSRHPALLVEKWP
jgi:hypothetical protein